MFNQTKSASFVCLFIVLYDLLTAQDKASAALWMGERSILSAPQRSECCKLGLTALWKFYSVADTTRTPASPHLPLGRWAPSCGQETNSWRGERRNGFTKTISGVNWRPSHFFRRLTWRAFTPSSPHIQEKQYSLGSAVWSGRWSIDDSRKHQSGWSKTKEING